MTRKVDVRTYLNYLLQYLNVEDLKQVCRYFKINDVLNFKKSELIDFITESLTEEEIGNLLEQKELEIISDGIEVAINKIQEEDPESIIEINITDPDKHKIEILFRGISWETNSFLSITGDNINNPERGCDCRSSLNKGFCNHFWIGFIFSLKQDYFKLSDWSLTPLPEDFEEKIKSIKITYYPQYIVDDEPSLRQISLIDEGYNGFQLNKGASVTIYEGEITEIVEKQSVERAQFHDLYSDEYLERLRKEGLTYYMVLLKNLKIGPRVSRKNDFLDEIKDKNILKLKTGKRTIKDNKLEIKDKISAKFKISRDYFWGFVASMSGRKIEKLDQNQISPYYLINEEKIRKEEFRKKREEQDILETIQEFADEFTRIHINELVNKLKMSEKKVIEIIEKLIKNNIIPATYDPNTQGIEFNPMGEIIDELSTTIEGWGKGDPEQVNSSSKKK